METSIFIAKIIGIIYTSFGVGLLFSGDFYKKEFPKLLDNTAFLILGGILAIIMGILIIEKPINLHIVTYQCVLFVHS